MLFLLENYSGDSHINVGTGIDLDQELAETIQSIVHPDAVINWDRSKPDGTPANFRLSRLRRAWLGTISLVN